MWGFEFEHKIDIGHFLTAITLAAGFVWWIITTTAERRRNTRNDTRSGALRLLLKILRKHSKPMTLRQLMEEFNSDERTKERKVYCGRNFLFKDVTVFETAIYRLDWEMKIHFVGPDEIVFRLHPDERRATVQTTPEDQAGLLDALERGIETDDIQVWDLDKLCESCMRLWPDDCASRLRDLSKRDNPKTSVRAASLLARFAASTKSEPPGASAASG